MASAINLLKKLSAPLNYVETQIIIDKGEYLRKKIKMDNIYTIDELKNLPIEFKPQEVEYSLFLNGIPPSYDEKVVGGRLGYKIKDATKIQGINVTTFKPPYAEYLFKRIGSFLLYITENDNFKKTPLSKVEGITFTYLPSKMIKIFICVNECLTASEATIIAKYFKKGLALDPKFSFAYTEYKTKKYEFY